MWTKQIYIYTVQHKAGEDCVFLVLYAINYGNNVYYALRSSPIQFIFLLR